MNRQDLYDRIAGCLMAGALGDALGYVVEFSNWNNIQHRFGSEGIQTLVPLDGMARFSDDTQMTLFTNEGMLMARTGDNDLSLNECIYHAYLAWLQTQEGIRRSEPKSRFATSSALLKIPELNVPRAPGNTCLSALASGTMGTTANPINNSKGCGGVMRTAPLGFTAKWGSPLVTGADAAAITHGHPGGWAPGGMLSDLVYRLIYGEPQPLESAVLDSLGAVRAAWNLPSVDVFTDMVFEAMELSHENTADVKAIHSLGGGWVGDEALAIAIYCCLKHPYDIKAALISAVNHGGDSDSTGAIAGNIMGAKLGLKAVPKDWIDQLELTDLILDQAQRAAQAAAEDLQFPD